MAKSAEVQKELELEDKKKTESTNDKAEVVVVGKEDKEKVDAKPAVSDAVDPEVRIKELQDQMAKVDADRKAQADRIAKLETEKREEIAKTQKAEVRASMTQKDAINQALSASEEALATAKRELKLALEAGDSEKAVNLQEKLAEAKYANNDWKKNKVNYDAWEKQQEELAKQRQSQPAVPTPAAQSWIARNPRFTQDTEFAQEAEAAYALGARRGFALDSVEHYKFVDSRLKQIYGSGDTEPTVTVTQETKKSASYSAPPSRGSASSDSNDAGGKKVYKLTAAQVEAAGFMGMTPVEYAQFLEAEKERG